MGNQQSAVKVCARPRPNPVPIVQGVPVVQGEPVVQSVPVVQGVKIEVHEDLNNLYYLKKMFEGCIDRHLEYPNPDYKIYLSKSKFERVWKGTTEDGYIELPGVNILSNLRFENADDIDLIESVVIGFRKGFDNDYEILDNIPTSIFKQLQDFYKMKRDCIPCFMFKYGLPTRYQTCKLKFKYKPNVEKKEISLLVNVDQNLNDDRTSFQTPVYCVKEVEIENDKWLSLYNPAYFFIPERKMDNIVLKLNNRYHIKLKYDDDKKIVPLVNGLDFNNHANYMLNFKRVDVAKMEFLTEGYSITESMKAYFICPSVYMYHDGIGGKIYN